MSGWLGLMKSYNSLIKWTKKWLNKKAEMLESKKLLQKDLNLRIKRTLITDLSKIGKFQNGSKSSQSTKKKKNLRS